MARTLPYPTPAGAVRRARALATRGWASETIERTAGIPAADCRRALENKRAVSPAAARRIAAAYDQLWDRQPPRATSDEGQLAQSAAAHARARGWAPPMAWDDEQLDRPEGSPAPGWKRSPSPKRWSADLAEDVAFVRKHGGYSAASIPQIALRLGVTPGAIDKALARTRGREAELEVG